MNVAAARVGILGGTFDPPHLGHLDAAAAAQRALGLETVRFVPAHDPPHRPSDPQASVFHRFALVALAIEPYAGYEVSDLELKRTGPSYTALTLRDLHAEGWQPSQLFFIVGADAFAEIATWYDFPAILDLCHYAVIARPGMTTSDAMARTPALIPRVRPLDHASMDAAGTGIFLVEASTSGASSTTIRARLSTDRSIDDLVPPAVARHIHRHHLYKTVDALHGQD